MLDYSNYLLTKRVELVNNKLPKGSELRLLRTLWIPDMLQEALTFLGKAIDFQYGITYIPEVTEPSRLTFKDAQNISDKIAAFQKEMAVVTNAFPRDIDGDIEVMSLANIANEMRSMRLDIHPDKVRIAAFLDNKILKEITLQVCYRQVYDHYDYLESLFEMTDVGVV